MTKLFKMEVDMCIPTIVHTSINRACVFNFKYTALFQIVLISNIYLNFFFLNRCSMSVKKNSQTLGTWGWMLQRNQYGGEVFISSHHPLLFKFYTIGGTFLMPTWNSVDRIKIQSFEKITKHNVMDIHNICIFQ